MSDRVIISRHTVAMQDDLRPGEYYQIKRGMVYGDFLQAILRCPECKTLMSIGRSNHDVDHEGVVSPEITCPHVCEFNSPCVFAGWLPEPRGNA